MHVISEKNHHARNDYVEESTILKKIVYPQKTTLLRLLLQCHARTTAEYLDGKYQA